MGRIRAVEGGGIEHNRHGIRVIEAFAFITTSLSE